MSPSAMTEQTSASNRPAADQRAEVTKLTAEEQMARFEEALKQEDWGHQPC